MSKDTGVGAFIRSLLDPEMVESEEDPTPPRHQHKNLKGIAFGLGLLALLGLGAASKLTDHTVSGSPSGDVASYCQTLWQEHGYQIPGTTRDQYLVDCWDSQKLMKRIRERTR